ncbi:hypothetical protein B7P43_G11523 [Cryptotermes secundus]|uniref:Uncharacterized protein n=1 Tax=Cryptotermes secundus TaxID=105785 RepID=A0A2J7RGX3_9NEOP|nr:uncharacterized protein LOC111875770 [Cryptotermes secundus]PNF40067.1 hypothetical protein B7P43_G11523 [Cryptotermes secundus]
MVKLLQRLILQHQKLSPYKALAQRYASHGGCAKTVSTPANVPGLSSAVYKVPPGDVGPGASKDGKYKNPEYFCYNQMSYFEAEVEMLKYRLPQPSNKPKKK